MTEPIVFAFWFMAACALTVGLALGLWIGQLGRNRDLRYMAGLRRQDHEPARVYDGKTGERKLDTGQVGAPVLLPHELDRLAAFVEAEGGMSTKEARAHAEQLINQVQSG